MSFDDCVGSAICPRRHVQALRVGVETRRLTKFGLLGSKILPGEALDCALAINKRRLHLAACFPVGM